MTDELIFSIAFGSFVVGYLLYTVYNRQNKLKLVDAAIANFYREKGREVEGISKLNARERIKYGVPMSPYISFYQSPFSMMRMANQPVCRSVETTGESGKEYISYVEVSFSGREGMSVNEFDRYEF